MMIASDNVAAIATCIPTTGLPDHRCTRYLHPTLAYMQTAGYKSDTAPVPLQV